MTSVSRESLVALQTLSSMLWHIEWPEQLPDGVGDDDYAVMQQHAARGSRLLSNALWMVDLNAEDTVWEQLQAINAARTDDQGRPIFPYQYKDATEYLSVLDMMVDVLTTIDASIESIIMPQMRDNYSSFRRMQLTTTISVDGASPQASYQQYPAIDAHDQAVSLGLMAPEDRLIKHDNLLFRTALPELPYRQWVDMLPIDPWMQRPNMNAMLPMLRLDAHTAQWLRDGVEEVRYYLSACRNEIRFQRAEMEANQPLSAVELMQAEQTRLYRTLGDHTELLLMGNDVMTQLIGGGTPVDAALVDLASTAQNQQRLSLLLQSMEHAFQSVRDMEPEDCPSLEDFQGAIEQEMQRFVTEHQGEPLWQGFQAANWRINRINALATSMCNAQGWER